MPPEPKNLTWRGYGVPEGTESGLMLTLFKSLKVVAMATPAHCSINMAKGLIRRAENERILLKRQFRPKSETHISGPSPRRFCSVTLCFHWRSTRDETFETVSGWDVKNVDAHFLTHESYLEKNAHHEVLWIIFSNQATIPARRHWVPLSSTSEVQLVPLCRREDSTAGVSNAGTI